MHTKTSIRLRFIVEPLYHSQCFPWLSTNRV